ncbi:MAG: hypothetical protein K8H84_04220 [Sulfuricella denitrificans]|nr:hypothetical protein [Sulfuricella denitrificans]
MKDRSRLLLFLALAFSLLFAQQGAAMHALSHLGETLPSHSQQDKQLPHSPACDKCVVYAGIGSALTASALTLPAAVVHDRHLELIPASLLSWPAGSYLARAPPTLV